MNPNILPLCLCLLSPCFVHGSFESSSMTNGDNNEIHTIILRRSRKAGSGTIAKFFNDEVKWREGNNLLPSKVTLLLNDGTTHPFDSCCIAPCNKSKNDQQPWNSKKIFTVSHIREPVEWRRTEYYYGGAGSESVKPSNRSIATPRDHARLWVEWMSEYDETLKPKDKTCGNEELLGYENRFDKKFHWHTGFGFYQPNFMVKKLFYFIEYASIPSCILSFL